MADSIVKDFLGHPCRTTEAFEYYEEEIEEARKSNQGDSRFVARQVGINVMEVQHRIERLCSLIDAMAKHIQNDSDSDELRAMVEVGSEYAIKTSGRFSNLAGVTLHALEKGLLWDPAKEQEHG